ncbi:unnamed protein product [Linum tenue]|uniref:Senescence regulator n=1 Tax=Linum tenue TaxID=586396 RepID=A0AAV0PYJ0_9ROSI|nr:unnamed protein product [Linum tenue]
MAAVEEFQESDVFFSGDHHRETADPHHHRHEIRRQPRSSNKKQKKWSSSSIPANVFRFGDLEELEDDEYEEEEAQGLVPPHVILARRVAGEMAFSVCTGNGRTLKGRDLSQVRNSILRMTGFLET